MSSDLAGLGKVAEVILQAVGGAIGTVIEPWRVRRLGHAQADAEAYAIERRAEAEVKADLIKQQANSVVSASEHSDELGIRERAAQRLVTREIERQKNLELIIAEATDHASEAESDGAEPEVIDNDWIHAFIDYAQNVSHEALRDIWARILASQAIQGTPSVSKATLDAIRLIEPSEAKMFLRAAQIYRAMGQIMEVDAVDGVDIGYLSHMRESTGLEDLGLLKRMRDMEQHLDLNGGILVFWRDVHGVRRDDGSYDYHPWTDESVREAFLDEALKVARGHQRDHDRLRADTRVDRQILTSRGFELASIVIPDFYDIRDDAHLNVKTLGDFGREHVQEKILRQWAGRLSQQGLAVMLAHPEPNDAGSARLITFDPKLIYDPELQDWVSIEH